MLDSATNTALQDAHRAHTRDELIRAHCRLRYAIRLRWHAEGEARISPTHAQHLQRQHRDASDLIQRRAQQARRLLAPENTGAAS
jgi:hypothetical protein